MAGGQRRPRYCGVLVPMKEAVEVNCAYQSGDMPLRFSVLSATIITYRLRSRSKPRLASSSGSIGASAARSVSKQLPAEILVGRRRDEGSADWKYWFVATCTSRRQSM